MARKGLIQNNELRARLCAAHFVARQALKKRIKSAIPIEEKLVLIQKLDDMPDNGSPVKYRRRCAATGRARGVNRWTGLCRHKAREEILAGRVPGFKKGRSRG